MHVLKFETVLVYFPYIVTLKRQSYMFLTRVYGMLFRSKHTMSNDYAYDKDEHTTLMNSQS